MIFWQYGYITNPNSLLVIHGNYYIFFYINTAKTSCIQINIGLSKNYRKKINKKIPDNSVPNDFPKESIIRELFRNYEKYYA